MTVGQKLANQPTAENPSNSGVGDSGSEKVGKSWSKVGKPTNSKSPSNGESQTKVGKVGQNNHFDNQSMEDSKDGEKENLESWHKSWSANQLEPTLPTNSQNVDTEGNETVGQFNQLLTNSNDTDQLNNMTMKEYRENTKFEGNDRAKSTLSLTMPSLPFGVAHGAISKGVSTKGIASEGTTANFTASFRRSGFIATIFNGMSSTLGAQSSAIRFGFGQFNAIFFD